MTKARWSAGAAVALAVGLSGAAAQAQSAKQVLSFAQSILNNLQCTNYDYEQHAGKTPSGVPVVFAQPGQTAANSFTDCSGFVDFTVANAVGGGVPASSGSYANCQAIGTGLATLQTSLPALGSSPAYTALIAYWKTPGLFTYDVANFAWPRASTWTRMFYDIQTGAPAATAAGVNAHFAPVTDFRTLTPGTVLAWCFDGYCTAPAQSHPTDADTGHVVVVAGAPVTNTTYSATGPSCGALSASTTWPAGTASVIGVPVIDSSSVTHFTYTVDGNQPYANGRGGTSPTTATTKGLGAGCIAMALNGEGAPLGIAFNASQSPAWHASVGVGTVAGGITATPAGNNFVIAGQPKGGS